MPILYWSDPLYSKGFQYQLGDQSTSNFSVDSGSVLKIGDKFSIASFVFNADNSEKWYTVLGGPTISSTLGGTGDYLPFSRFDKAEIGDKIINIAIFKDKKAYLVLPPFEVIA